MHQSLRTLVGGGGYLYGNWFVDSVAVTSDERAKKNVQPLEEYLWTSSSSRIMNTHQHEDRSTAAGSGAHHFPAAERGLLTPKAQRYYREGPARRLNITTTQQSTGGRELVERDLMLSLRPVA